MLEVGWQGVETGFGLGLALQVLSVLDERLGNVQARSSVLSLSSSTGHISCPKHKGVTVDIGQCLLAFMGPVKSLKPSMVMVFSPAQFLHGGLRTGNSGIIWGLGSPRPTGGDPPGGVC